MNWTKVDLVIEWEELTKKKATSRIWQLPIDDLKALIKKTRAKNKRYIDKRNTK